MPFRLSGRQFWVRGGMAALAAWFLFAVAVPSWGQGPAVPDEPVIREQTIYIPYTRLRETFEKQGRGVFLPYEKFQELWQAAQSATAKPPEVRAPVGALISAIDSRAEVRRDVLHVTARLQIELLAPGWHRIPLRLGDAALLSARLGEEPAQVLFDKDGYYLLIKAATPAAVPVPVPPPGVAPPVAAPPLATPPAATPPAVTPPVVRPAAVSAPPVFVAQRRELTLEYAKAYAKHPGQNSVSFEAPQAPVNRWEIRIAPSGTKITLEPLLAATEIPTAAKPDGAPADGGPPADVSVLQAFVGAAATVKVDWTAKSEGAAGLAALVNVQARQQVRVDEGVVRTQTQLAYDISRADLGQLQVDLPADQRVINVFDPNVRQWDVKPQGDKQRITVQLFQPTRGRQALVVETERFLAEMKAAELSVPVVQAVDVVRQQGIVLIKLAPELRAEVVRRVGLTQLDAAELPQEAAGQGWDFTFRYATLPFDLALTLDKVQPRVQVDELVEVYLEPDRISAELLAVYQIERAGVFQLDLTLPAGYELKEVRGHKVGDAEPAAVDAHRVEGEQKERLVVSLGRKALGKIGLVVRLEKRLDDPNLAQPTGQASQFELPLPRSVATAVEGETGRLVVHAPESLRVHAQESDGLRPVPVQEALQGLESQRAGRFATTREVLAFAFGKTPARLQLAAERRRPAVTARQLLVARLETGVVKYEATIFYDVRYSGVKSLRIDVPQALAGRIHNETPAYREKTLEKPEPPPSEGAVAWSFTGETELLGQHTLKLTWEQPLEELAVGGSREVVVPRLTPRDAELERAWGQVVVTKAETLDIRPTGTPRGLRPIDPQHDLMPGVAVADAARAFEFQADWELTLAVQRYQLEEVKRTAIELALVRMVVTRSGSTTVQALYRVRSARQRLGLKLPPDFQLDTQPLRVNGQRQDLERGEANELFIPLVNKAAGEPVVLEFRYTVPRGASQLDLPEFLDDPAVQQVFAAVYLPTELALLGWLGDWTEEFTWQWSLGTVPQPVARQEDSAYLERLTRDVQLERPIGDDFPLDGTRYVFSTLRPDPAPDGSLSLVTLKRLWLRVLVLLIVGVLGVIGWRKSWTERLVILAAVLGSLVLSGTVLATLTRQVADGMLLAGLAVMLLIWAGRSVLQGISELLAARHAAAEEAARLARQSAAAASAAGEVPFQAVAVESREGVAPAAAPPAASADQKSAPGESDHA
ncbi:MAG: hypothetical protein U0935_03920 [Pirellulales bacterium]